MLENVIVAVNDIGGPWGEAMWRAGWQGGLALAAAWLVCRLWRRMPAGAQCWLWRVAYVKLLVSLLWAGAVALPALPGFSPVAELQRSVATATAFLPAATPSPAVEGVVLPEVSQVAVAPGDGSAVVQAAATPAAKRATLPSLPGALLLCWLLGVGWGVRRLWRARGEARRILRSARPLEDAGALEALESLRECFRLRSLPRLATGEVASPVLLGAWRPLIVLPTELHPEELPMMLAHELAHARRRDLAWNGLAAMVETLFFFHPLLWPARREWRLAQEMACDALAVERSATPRSAYGVMLVSVAASGRPAPDLLAAGISESYRTLARRLAAIGERAHFTRRRLIALGAGLLLLGALVLVPWRLAHGEPEEKAVSVEPVETTLDGIPIENTVGKKPELTIKEPVYQNMPVWVSITSVNIRYPFRSEPWFAWEHDFEVMRDGTPLQRIKNAGQFPSTFVFVGFSHNSINVPNAPAGRLPLHLWYRFDKPGMYRIRYIRHDDHWNGPGSLSVDGESNIVPSKIVQASDWVTLEVKPYSAEERQTWQRKQIANLPTDAGKLVGDILPSLLASPDETSLPAFVQAISHKDKLVREYALNSLRYFDRAVLKQGMPNLGIYPMEEATGSSSVKVTREEINAYNDKITSFIKNSGAFWDTYLLGENKRTFDEVTVKMPAVSTETLPFMSLNGRSVINASFKWHSTSQVGLEALPSFSNSLALLVDEQTGQLIRVTLPAEPKIAESAAWHEGLIAAFSGFPAAPPKVPLFKALKIIASQGEEACYTLAQAERIDAYYLLIEDKPRWVISVRKWEEVFQYMIDAESGRIARLLPIVIGPPHSHPVTMNRERPAGELQF